MKSKTIILVALAFAVIISVLRYFQAETQRPQLSSSREERSLGMSKFYQLIEEIPEIEVETRGSPITDFGFFEGKDTYFLFDPFVQLPDRELDYLMRFVKGGGTLYIQFLKTLQDLDDHIDEEIIEEKSPEETKDQTTMASNFQANPCEFVEGIQSNCKLLSNLGIEAKVQRHPRFENGETNKILIPDLTYEFYSHYVFDRKECRDGNQYECYVQERDFGEGRVILQLGVSIFSNGLISQSDNKEFLFDLLETASSVVIDEYAIWGTDKTISQLVLHPKFIIPTTALVLIILLFFAFSDNQFRRSTERDKHSNHSMSFHSFGASFQRPLFKKTESFDDCLKSYRKWLAKIFPDKRAAIERLKFRRSSNTGQSLAQARKIVAVHKKILKEKGILPIERNQ